MAAEEGHLRLYWAPYCDLQRTPYIRPDVRALSFDEIQVEEAWWGGFVPWVAARMPNRQGVLGLALPSSNLKPLRNMRRAHKRLGIETVSLRTATRATDGLLRRFVLEHGPLALVPKRKEPLTNEEILAMFSLDPQRLGSGRGAFAFDWRLPRFSSLIAMFHVLAQTGMRKGEDAR